MRWGKLKTLQKYDLAMQLLGNAEFANCTLGQRLKRDACLHVLLTTTIQPSPPSSHSSTVSSVASWRSSKPGDVLSSLVLTLRSESRINNDHNSKGKNQNKYQNNYKKTVSYQGSGMNMCHQHGTHPWKYCPSNLNSSNYDPNYSKYKADWRKTRILGSRKE